MGFYKNSQRNQYNNNQEKRKYPDESTRMFTLRVGAQANIRVLNNDVTTTYESYIKGPERTSKAGKKYTPGGYVTQVSHIPVFEGRCALSKIIPNHKPTKKTNISVFDFGYYHVSERESGNSISVSHKPCLSKTIHPNEGVCEECSWSSPRILGGRRVFQLTSGQMAAFEGHESHVMQFAVPFKGEGDGLKFFGKKVRCISASCESCSHEIFGEKRLQIMSNLEIIAAVTQMQHECPNCGHTGYLEESLLCDQHSVRRGEITWKNLEVTKEKTNKGSRMVFNSDLNPFQSLVASAQHLGIPEQDYVEACNREFNFHAASSPYGIDVESFKDKEKYVKLVTDQQVRQLNWIIHGTARDRYWSNPFFS